MKKILIIEDDTDIREVTCTFLEIKNFDVLSASDGTLGIKTAMEDVPDIILCDIMMPGLNGYQVFEVLQANHTTSHIPFIFVTARTEKEDIRTGMQMGADDYITKPFDFDELLTAINTRIEKREKILKHTEEKFSAIAENPLTGVCIFNENQFVFASNKFCEISGYTYDELKNKKFENLIDNKKKDDVKSKISRCFKGILDRTELSFDLITKDKKKKPVKFVGKTILLRGQKSLIGNMLESHQNIEEYIANIAENNEIDKIIDVLYQNKYFKKLNIAEDLKGIATNKTYQERLTKREQEVLDLVCKGYSTQEIAEKLYISTRTVDRHRANLLDKTDTQNLPQLIVFSIKRGLVSI